MAKRDDDRDESPLIVLGVFFLAFCVFAFLLWLVASNRIVYGSLGPALALGALWKLIPSDFTYSQWNAVVASVQKFAPNPTAVSIGEWAMFMMVALRPLAILLMIGYLGLLILVGFKRAPNLMRRISPDDLMALSMKHFTGIAPVVAIRQKIAKNKHPLWRRQVTPEEIFLKFKVPTTKAPSNGSLAKPGMPMMREGKFDREVARAYFIGATDLLPDGRLVSRMLGRQIVNLTVDAKKAKSIVFTDRLSSEGKAVMSLWAAIAFGGPEGRDDYCKYRDLLNMSAYATEDGIANLTVVQPLFEKYRKHPMLNKLFSIYHWEHTFLFALLALAQKKGRYTTAEVLWLRPLNRVMFFALNTRGSYTPHTESASTFAQHAYETVCAKIGHLPLMKDSSGFLTHVVYIDKAIDGLELECMRWLDADADDDDDWWAKKDIWKRATPTIDKSFEDIAASIPKAPMPGVDPKFESAFDVVSTAKAQEAAKAEEQLSEDQFANFLASAKGAD
jgi:hypothetical protein